MISKRGIRCVFKWMLYDSTVTMLLVVVLLESWRIPPKLLEKALLGVKAKFNTEIVRMDGTDTNEESISTPTENVSVRVMRGDDTT